MTLTGCTVEDINLHSPGNTSALKSGSLWQRLHAWGPLSHLCCAAFFDREALQQQQAGQQAAGGQPSPAAGSSSGSGIVPNHAYSILCIKETFVGAKAVQAIQLRNPNGGKGAAAGNGGGGGGGISSGRRKSAAGGRGGGGPPNFFPGALDVDSPQAAEDAASGIFWMSLRG
jgi:hypothetical protein